VSITVGAAVHEDLGVQFGALGPFQARVDGQWQSPPTRQIARVATMLAGWPGEVVEVTRLIDGVWGGEGAGDRPKHVAGARKSPSPDGRAVGGP
jgi:hypothetical protein